MDYIKYDEDEQHHGNKTLFIIKSIWKNISQRNNKYLTCIIFAFNPIEIGELFANHSAIS